MILRIDVLLIAYAMTWPGPGPVRDQEAGVQRQITICMAPCQQMSREVSYTACKRQLVSLFTVTSVANPESQGLWEGLALGPLGGGGRVAHRTAQRVRSGEVHSEVAYLS